MLTYIKQNDNPETYLRIYIIIFILTALLLFSYVAVILMVGCINCSTNLCSEILLKIMSVTVYKQFNWCGENITEIILYFRPRIFLYFPIIMPKITSVYK